MPGNNGRLLSVTRGNASKIEYVYGHTGSKLSEIWYWSGAAGSGSYWRLLKYDAWNSYGPTVIKEYLRKEGEPAQTVKTFLTSEEDEWALVRTTTFKW